MKKLSKTGQSVYYIVMYRKDSAFIKDWLENSNKALLETGARQVGKTWLIKDD